MLMQPLTLWSRIGYGLLLADLSTGFCLIYALLVLCNLSPQHA